MSYPNEKTFLLSGTKPILFNKNNYTNFLPLLLVLLCFPVFYCLYPNGYDNSKKCNSISNETIYTGKCVGYWVTEIKDMIHPTESQIGWSWVLRKILKKGYEDLNDEVVPAIFGPGNRLYITDSHHTLASLDYVGIDMQITMDILCDLRHLYIDDFWNVMEKNNYTYLYKHFSPNYLPEKIKWQQLPENFEFTPDIQTMSDDPWRSIISYAQKVTEPYGLEPCNNDDYKYCERCFYRGCGENGNENNGYPLYFFEYRWSYFFLYSTYYNNSIWYDYNDWSLFYKCFNNLPYNTMEQDVDEWQMCANYMIVLCRSYSTGEYIFPSNYISYGEKLPGYVYGTIPIDKDPECQKKCYII